ncbi:protein NLP7-like [Prunus yedoensis var. nudiflora]|uniref:Protein NLP7-like n=1 Tax=Prunus yedoensis var. nudiflora TaxID=2094558 RepID=A0A314Y6X2_PRUYE|nr:protein NLP7-like [Prunus yedoensis var. nudiflora]
MVQLDSSKPQLMVDFDPANDGSNAVNEGGENNISCLENNDNREQLQQDGSFFPASSSLSGNVGSTEQDIYNSNRDRRMKIKGHDKEFLG